MGLMDAEILKAIRGLLEGERVLTAAVLVEREPVAALLPYALAPQPTTLFVQASGLARHTRGLIPGATISVLIHAAATPDRDPMQLPRLTVQATVELLERGTPGFDRAAGRLLARFPAMEMTLGLEDFSVYGLRLGRGRYVEGFARAYNVASETFGALGA